MILFPMECLAKTPEALCLDLDKSLLQEFSV